MDEIATDTSVTPVLHEYVPILPLEACRVVLFPLHIVKVGLAVMLTLGKSRISTMASSFTARQDPDAAIV
jgi:hypothetical protein